jgi:hypothetical protein
LLVCSRENVNGGSLAALAKHRARRAGISCCQ